ncbi:MAG: crossover junction endodeoxyribonuclease RuvC [Candidatus Kapabacteria bacterium]|nr:crossover junction endodeoxyribonuclease RuvC [Candidatus Kapabacteria bacterium]
MVILGIDPGSVICGYGVIDYKFDKLKLIEYGSIKVKKKNEDIIQRLKDIFFRLNAVIERTKPEIAVFESVFYSKNAQSLMKLSYARASAILAASLKDLEFAEFTPREIKKSVTGNGNAGKKQVQFMVRTLLKIQETPDFYDATDALATAICYAFRNQNQSKTSSSWAEYIKNNPEKVLKV